MKTLTVKNEISLDSFETLSFDELNNVKGGDYTSRDTDIYLTYSDDDFQ